MKTYSFQLELITPCFCAGADQAKAEFRVPSIRGELRWWFRALGGSSLQEADLFGGVPGQTAVSSAVVIRILNQERFSGNFSLPSMRINTPLSYIWYFANASGKQRGQPFGPRFSLDGYLPPGSKIDLEIRFRRTISNLQEMDLLERSIWAFSHLGSLGYRATRGAGAWKAVPRESLEPLDRLEIVNRFFPSHGFDHALVAQNGRPLAFSSWHSCMVLLESCLKNSLRKQHPAGKSGDRPSPLGSARPRQRSGLRLRPLFVDSQYYACIFFKNDFLGKVSDKPLRLKGLTFEHLTDSRKTDDYSLL